MQFVEPGEKTTGESPREIALTFLEQAHDNHPDSHEQIADELFKALHDAGYRIAIARKQWR